eukprot:evm.model.NODE_1239_length_22662_cov_34.288322.10
MKKQELITYVTALATNGINNASGNSPVGYFSAHHAFPPVHAPPVDMAMNANANNNFFHLIGRLSFRFASFASPRL